MKILFLISSLGAGGAERVASTLCSAWAERHDEVTLISTYSASEGEAFYSLHPAVKLIQLSELILVKPNKGKNYWQRLRQLRKQIVENKPDLVISFLPNVNIAAILATSFTGVPCIISERSNPELQKLPWYWSLACRLMYRFADALTVQTQHVSVSYTHLTLPTICSV